jgi:hypothetical protein
MSFGSFFVHGLAGSGIRRAAKIFTTEFSTAFDGVAAGEEPSAGDGFGSGGVGVIGGGVDSAGAASANDAVLRQKISEAANTNVPGKILRKPRWIIGQRNAIQERKRAAFWVTETEL